MNTSKPDQSNSLSPSQHAVDVPSTGPGTTAHEKPIEERSSSSENGVSQASESWLAAIRVPEEVKSTSLWRSDKPLRPFDLASLRVTSAQSCDTVAVPAVPAVKKPGDQTFFRTIEDESQWHDYHTYMPNEDMGKTVYLVSPQLAPELGSIVKLKMLVPYITLEGVLGFWPISASDWQNTWSASARVIAGKAKKAWTIMKSNRAAQRYESRETMVPKPEPQWPEKKMLDQLFEKAFEGMVIYSTDHPALRKFL